jgi:predicted hotdog family 3-hydroxylacyl-ACP dehydratase
MPALPLDIEKLIPHRGRMKLIDEVLEINTDRAITSSVVTDQWPLCHGSFVDPIVLIEIVAQTAGIHIRWKKDLDAAGGGTGWIVGIKETDFFLDRIPVHTVLITTVKNLYNSDTYNVIEGEVAAGTERLFRTQLQVFRTGSDSARTV